MFLVSKITDVIVSGQQTMKFYHCETLKENVKLMLKISGEYDQGNKIQIWENQIQVSPYLVSQYSCMAIMGY